MALSRAQSRKRRHLRVRSKISGTAQRPRLSVHKSLRHIYAQLIDDTTGRTLAAATTVRKGEVGHFGNIDSARRLGAQIAEKAKGAGIEAVVFDRGGARYHGVVKAFGDAAREAGLKF